MPDYVDKTDPTDQNADNTGCGMAFISWLMSLSQGYVLDKIAPVPVGPGAGGTLAQLYASLRSQPASNAWSSFQAAVNALPKGVTSEQTAGCVIAGGPPVRESSLPDRCR
jgi:hypothetical protein